MMILATCRRGWRSRLECPERDVASGIKTPTFSQLYGSQWVDGDLSLKAEQAVTA